ncbi:hypothetical protein [Enterobacter ludwigii]|uniref:hypothetical protein n=1 Tax=Enterobacter ludwigii TaxID=299767 RepID=UPI003F702B59
MKQDTKHHRAHALSAIATACALTGSLLSAIPAHASTNTNDPADMTVQIAMTTDKDTCGVSVAQPANASFSRSYTVNTTVNPSTLVWDTPQANNDTETLVSATGGGNCTLTGLIIGVNAITADPTLMPTGTAGKAGVYVELSGGVYQGFTPALKGAHFFSDSAGTTATNAGNTGWALTGNDQETTRADATQPDSTANRSQQGPGFEQSRPLVLFTNSNIQTSSAAAYIPFSNGKRADVIRITPPASLTDDVKAARFLWSANTAGYPIDLTGQRADQDVPDGSQADFQYEVTYSLS